MAPRPAAASSLTRGPGYRAPHVSDRRTRRARGRSRGRPTGGAVGPPAGTFPRLRVLPARQGGEGNAAAAPWARGVSGRGPEGRFGKSEA